MARYKAPSRDSIAPEIFAHPIFAHFERWHDWLTAPGWPQIAAFNAALPLQQSQIEPKLRFVAQTPALLADALHYESRIAEHGQIATRENNWHDLFNAMIWLRYPALKRAMNKQQASEIARIGGKQRSRAQCALTHFDEAGAIVVLHDRRLLALWDAHDWPALFWRERAAWGSSIDVIVFGHALLEHALMPTQHFVAKALVVVPDSDVLPVLDQNARLECAERAVTHVAARIEEGELLNDPQELRPLPLSGIPGWHANGEEQEFYASAPCFRARREDRIYPEPSIMSFAAKVRENA